MEEKLSIHITISLDGAVTVKKVKLDSFVIGRHADCDVNVLHPQVSRQHLRVSIIDNKIYCEDLGSSNGTFKNSGRMPAKKSFTIEPHDALQLGDEGPTLLIQFGEKKTTFVSKVAPVIPIKPPTPASTSPKVVASAASVIPQMPAFASAPKANAPVADLKESEKTIQEANKKAAQILQEAEIQAEAKAQKAYKHAAETEQRAEKLYQERIQAANVDAEKVYEVTKEENKNLLQEARNKAEAIRERAEIDARELRKITEDQCSEFLKQSKVQGEEFKTKRLSEADEIIDKKGKALLAAAQETIEKQKSEALANLDSLKAQSSRVREQKVAFEAELAVLEKDIANIKSQFQKNHEELAISLKNMEKAKADEKNLLSNVEKLKKEIQEQEKIQQKHKLEIEKSIVNLASLKQDKENSEKEMHSQLQALKEKLTAEKEAMIKSEADRTNALKVSTAAAIKSFENQLIEDVINRRAKITKEILLQIESNCMIVAISEEWKSKHLELQKIIQDVISGSKEDIKKIADGKMPSQFPIKKEKAFSLMVGLFAGMVILAGLQKFTLVGGSPVERKVASAIDAAKQDLEKRRYSPEQTFEVRNNYVDSVIFTEAFSQTYNDPAFQESWNKAATKYLLKTWRLDEDGSAKALSMSAALVKDLADRKEKIHPDFVKKGITQMRAVEKETLARLKSELGGEVRLESFKKFEKKFFEKYDRSPANN